MVTLPYTLPYLSFVATHSLQFPIDIHLPPPPPPKHIQLLLLSSQSLQEPQRFLFNSKTNKRPLPLISHAMSFIDQEDD